MFDVAVIGGGIIGVACTIELLEAGHSVVLIDPDEPGAGTAAGSAGYLSDGEIFPLAQARTLAALPALLFDAHSALVVKPSAVPGLIGWGIRFASAARPARVRAGIAALASLNRSANGALYALAERSKAAAYLKREGALHVARSSRAFERALACIAPLAEHGLLARRVERDELLRLEPALGDAPIAGAVEYPNSMRCTDPAAFGTALAAHAARLGATFVRSRVRRLTPAENGSWGIESAAAAPAARRVVVTAGAWSARLLRPLGYVVPLQAARGYHLMLPRPAVAPRRTLLFEDAHFCATPMDGGLRLAGTVEFARLDSPPDFARATALYPVAAGYLPGLRAEGATRWMGNRPSFPDSLPAIGAGRRHRNLFYCFGHEKLGLTQAAISARGVAALAGDEPAPFDLKPFALERFL